MKDRYAILITIVIIIIAVVAANNIMQKANESISTFREYASYCKLCNNTTIDNKTACEKCDEWQRIMKNIQT